MEKNSNGFAGLPGGNAKNAITGKTIREMTREELFSLAGKPMTPAEAMRQMSEVRSARQTKPAA